MCQGAFFVKDLCSAYISTLFNYIAELYVEYLAFPMVWVVIEYQTRVPEVPEFVGTRSSKVKS